MTAPDPLARPSRKTIAAALDALAIATPAEIRAAAEIIGEDGRRDAIIGALGAAVGVARYHAEDTSASAVAYSKGDGDGADPLRLAAELFCESAQADIAAARAEEALDAMRKAEGLTFLALSAPRFDDDALARLRRALGV